MANPWMKFYPTDWRADPRLKMCGLAARGLWIEMIALMHESTPYGHLHISGISPTDAQLAVLVGALPNQIPDLIGELQLAGVFSRTKEGVIYSRKMTRMAKKSAIARKNGKTGGNPKLSKQTVISPSVNQNPTNQDKPQKPEARSQKERKKERICRKPPKRRFTYPDDFNLFWKAYPTTPIMSKKEAFTAFKKLDEPQISDLLKATPLFVAHCKNKPDYPPVHACRFISQERYEGFILASKKMDNRVFIAKHSRSWNAMLQKKGVVTLPETKSNGIVGWHFEKSDIESAVRDFDQTKFEMN